MRGNLANKIVLALVGFSITVIIGLLFSISSIQRAMNDQSQEVSLRAVQSRMSTLHDKLRMMARDYNNWADVYVALQRSDLVFVADNYAITAIFGDMFNAVSMFDGQLQSPLAWLEKGDRRPTSSFLSAFEMAKIREHVMLHHLGRRETFDFYMMISGELNFVSASYILPDTEELLKEVERDSLTIAVLARKLRETEMREMEHALMIEHLEIVEHTGPGHTFIPLVGVNDEPIAFLSWSPSRGGDALVGTMLPVLIGIVSAFLFVAATGIAAVHRYAQKLVQREKEATVLARMDTLTGLPNRLAFNEYLTSAVSNSLRHFGLIALDLNGLKRINDVVGHLGGDRVIRETGQALAKLMGPDVFVARLGGDEFAVGVIDSFDVLSKVESLSLSIAAELHRPVVIQGHSFEISAAQGAAICDSGLVDANEVLRRADFAMYSAKNQKSRRIKIYSETMECSSQVDRQIEAGLRSAIELSEEFYMEYQPIVAATSGRFVKAEALARWKPPFLGQVGPDSFIRIAEESGLIFPLGRLLLSRVCRDIKCYPGLCVSVNVSPFQFMDDCFVEDLLSVLALHEILPTRIEIEVTESVMIMNTAIMAQRLRDLQSLGISVALDDFGSGFSSFGSLRALPFDTLKIDKTLVACTSGSARNSALVHSVIMLGQSMGKQIVGEGVETEDDALYLVNSGCDLLQGYLFGKPVPISELATRFFGTELISA